MAAGALNGAQSWHLGELDKRPGPVFVRGRGGGFTTDQQEARPRHFPSRTRSRLRRRADKDALSNPKAVAASRAQDWERAAAASGGEIARAMWARTGPRPPEGFAHFRRFALSKSVLLLPGEPADPRAVASSPCQRPRPEGDRWSEGGIEQGRTEGAECHNR